MPPYGAASAAPQLRSPQPPPPSLSPRPPLSLPLLPLPPPPPPPPPALVLTVLVALFILVLLLPLPQPEAPSAAVKPPNLLPAVLAPAPASAPARDRDTGLSSHAGTMDDGRGRGPRPKQCDWVPDPGPCHAFFRRYFFNPDTKTCETFVYGGCEGRVPFRNAQQCEVAQCARSSAPAARVAWGWQGREGGRRADMGDMGGAVGRGATAREPLAQATRGWSRYDDDSDAAADADAGADASADAGRIETETAVGMAMGMGWRRRQW